MRKGNGGKRGEKETREENGGKRREEETRVKKNARLTIRELNEGGGPDKIRGNGQTF